MTAPKKTRKSSIGIDRTVHRRTQDERNEIASECIAVAVDALQAAKAVLSRNYGPAKKNIASVKRGVARIRL